VYEVDEEVAMPTYVVLARMTQQGVATAKDIPKRRAAAREAAEKLGITFREGMLTMGKYDVVFILDAPDDATLAKFVLQIGMQGNLSTQTLRAFSDQEADAILGSL
jgi:uncharacterized protein with GYD domain